MTEDAGSLDYYMPARDMHLRLPRDNQDENACCLTKTCSGAVMALPHLNVP